MIQVENITKTFGEQLLYENLSLSIQERSRIALIAINGAGKTTLLNIIAKVEEPDSGSIVYRNDIRIGYLSQKPDIDESLTVLEAIYRSDDEISSTVRDYEKAILESNHELTSTLLTKMDSLNAWDFEYRAKEILSRLKIRDLSQRVSTLSGGQLKRVALAIVLINDPDVLILDEPTNHLDLEMSAWLEEYLIKRDKTLLMVTHDRYFLERVCTNIYELDQCSLFQYKGSYNDYLLKRNERIEQFNSEVERAQNLYRRELEWMRRMPQARGHKAKYREDAFYEIKDKAFKKRNDATIEIALGGSRLGTKIFEMKEVSKSFDSSKVILDKFSYTFSRYEKLGIIGNNGTGKSTFLKILTGGMSADSGITDIGESVKFGYFRQDGVDFDENKRVIDVIKDIAEVVTLANGSTITASQLLTHFLFTPDTQYNYVYKLSGGEKRKLYLLTILMESPNFLILDEPTNDLDIVTLNILEEFLAGFGGCLIVVSHDRYFMDKVVDHLLVFEGNGVLRIFEGNYTQYRNAELDKIDMERKAEKPQQQVEKVAKPKNNTRKLTYKEKCELEALDKEIPELEAKKAELEAKMSNGTLGSDEIMTISKEYEALTEDLDEKSFRWLELSEI
ncbi:MAG: ABC-F family ATP-binding cassette domain-containing protein [Rikenellaceae bacterium]